jgi:hypothetical protein
VAGPWGEAAWSGGHNVAYALISAYRAAVHASARPVPPHSEGAERDALHA